MQETAVMKAQGRKKELEIREALAENQRRLEHNKNNGSQLPYLVPEVTHAKGD